MAIDLSFFGGFSLLWFMLYWVSVERFNKMQASDIFGNEREKEIQQKQHQSKTNETVRKKKSKPKNCHTSRTIHK